MATTTNFGWTTPDDTALVKDGASAIRTLGSSIDTSLVDLKGGTSGQVLSKNSNSDLDFTWVAQDDSNAIQNALLTTTGDTIYASGASTPARLAIGTSGQVLTVNGSGVPAWSTPAGGGSNWTLLNSGGTSLTGAQTVTVSGISGKDKIMVLLQDAASAGANSFIGVQLNGDTGSNYYVQGWEYAAPSTYAATNMGVYGGSKDRIDLGRLGGAGEIIRGFVTFTGCNASGVKSFIASGSGSGGVNQRAYGTGGYYNGSAVISSISVYSNSGNLNGGTVYVYASA